MPSRCKGMALQSDQPRCESNMFKPYTKHHPNIMAIDAQGWVSPKVPESSELSLTKCTGRCTSGASLDCTVGSVFLFDLAKHV